jgi:antitoxin component HigA of HigAB toxin-antitoxin module
VAFWLERSGASAYVTCEVAEHQERAMAAMPAAKIDTDKPVLRPAGQKYLRKAMAAHGKTVTALAAELGISRKHLSNVLNGRAPLIDPLLHRLCRALLISPALLVCLLDRGVRVEPAPHGFMKGSIVWHGDLTEPMEGWEMLED